MRFIAFVLPAFVNALPPLSSRDTAVGYHYSFPPGFNHTGARETVTLDQAQYNRLSSLVPVKINKDNSIASTGPPDLKKVADANEDISDRIDPRCPTCIAGCAILGPLGPEAVAPCGK